MANVVKTILINVCIFIAGSVLGFILGWKLSLLTAVILGGVYYMYLEIRDLKDPDYLDEAPDRNKYKK